MKKALLLSIVFIGCLRLLHAQQDRSFVLSQFSFEDTAGHKYNLDALKGKVVFVDCWFPGCPPCRAEMPYSQLLQKRLHTMQMDSNIVFVTISFKQSREEWLAALHRLPMPNAVHLYSPASTYEITMAGGNYPTYRIFNTKGELDVQPCEAPSSIGSIDFVLFATQNGLGVKKATELFLSQKDITQDKLTLIKSPLLRTFWKKYFDNLDGFQKDIDALRKAN